MLLVYSEEKDMAQHTTWQYPLQNNAFLMLLLSYPENFIKIRS